MRTIKLLAVGLVLALSGFVYAAGNAQDSKKSCAMDMASCCAHCCKSEDSCCKVHKTENKQTSAEGSTPDNKDCCAASDCCKGENACCVSGHKSDKTDKMKAQSCDMKKDSADCCASCCSTDKPKTS